MHGWNVGSFSMGRKYATVDCLPELQDGKAVGLLCVFGEFLGHCSLTVIQKAGTTSDGSLGVAC